jgi:hypothetical protein
MALTADVVFAYPANVLFQDQSLYSIECATPIKCLTYVVDEGLKRYKVPEELWSLSAPKFAPLPIISLKLVLCAKSLPAA